MSPYFWDIPAIIADVAIWLFVIKVISIVGVAIIHQLFPSLKGD